MVTTSDVTRYGRWIEVDLSNQLKFEPNLLIYCKNLESLDVSDCDHINPDEFNEELYSIF